MRGRREREIASSTAVCARPYALNHSAQEIHAPLTRRVLKMILVQIAISPFRLTSLRGVRTAAPRVIEARPLSREILFENRFTLRIRWCRIVVATMMRAAKVSSTLQT